MRLWNAGWKFYVQSGGWQEGITVGWPCGRLGCFIRGLPNVSFCRSFLRCSSYFLESSPVSCQGHAWLPQSWEQGREEEWRWRPHGQDVDLPSVWCFSPGASFSPPRSLCLSQPSISSRCVIALISCLNFPWQCIFSLPPFPHLLTP